MVRCSGVAPLEVPRVKPAVVTPLMYSVPPLKRISESAVVPTFIRLVASVPPFRLSTAPPEVSLLARWDQPLTVTVPPLMFIVPDPVPLPTWRLLIVAVAFVMVNSPTPFAPTTRSPLLDVVRLPPSTERLCDEPATTPTVTVPALVSGPAVTTVPPVWGWSFVMAYVPSPALRSSMLPPSVRCVSVNVAPEATSTVSTAFVASTLFVTVNAAVADFSPSGSVQLQPFKSMTVPASMVNPAGNAVEALAGTKSNAAVICQPPTHAGAVPIAASSSVEPKRTVMEDASSAL